jgi:hypothetical protein
MASTYKKIPRPRVVLDAEERGFPGLEVALIACALAVFFLLFPGIWASVISYLRLALSYIDVRSWTWRSYATVSVVSIVALVGLKSWVERDV